MEWDDYQVLKDLVCFTWARGAQLPSCPSTSVSIHLSYTLKIDLKVVDAHLESYSPTSLT